MKPAATLLLIVHTFFVSPLLHAQTMLTAPVSMPGVSAPLAVGAAMGQSHIGSMSLGAQSLGSPQLSLSALPSLHGPALQATLAAAPMKAISVSPSVRPAAAGVQAAAPKALTPAAKEPAKGERATPLDSLKEAAEPRKEEGGEAKGSAVSAMFDGSKAEPKDWTFMVFLNGHNNLDQFGELNIKQMEKVGSNDRVNIVVQWASLGKPTKRMLIQRSESGTVSSPVIEELPAVDMGSSDQLYEFIRWTVEKFPAKRYMVDLWDHGAGWHVNKRGVSNPQDISWDDQTGNHITTEQLGEVARRVKKLIGKPIDVLGFDACLMAMAEVMAQVADSVRYFAASEQTEPGAGWPYEKVLKQWLETKDDDGAALLKALTEQYTAAYSRNVNFSGLDLSKWPAFVEALKAYAKELNALDDAKFAQVRKAAQATRRYAYSDYGDFLDFVTRAAAAPEPVTAALLSAFKALVVANAATPDLKGSNGMSVWLPMSSYLWQQYGERYLKLVWSVLTDWGSFARRLSGGRDV